MKKIVILVALLLIPAVYAQLDWTITDLRCGNGVLDQFELCEEGLDNESRCDILAEKLGIDMGCFEKHCTCVPKVNPVYCGNDRRDFNELCDGTSSDDQCPVLGEIMGNITLKCNKTTCGCDIIGTPADYNPSVLEGYINKTQTASSCGDKKVERNEDCDPPNTLCTTSTKEAGVCTDKCKCVEPALLDEPEEVKANVSEDNATVENVAENLSEENVTEEPVDDEPGFFASIWAWFVGIFS